MQPAALGFRVHSGWTAMVAISADQDSPLVLLRERPHLVETFTYEFRQPYHTAKKKPAAEAGAFISRVQKEARHHACQTIQSVQKHLQTQGYELARCGLVLASGKQLPDLAHILASHALIHTADGELFREALLHASKTCGCEVFAAKESALLETASQTLRQPQHEIAHRLTGLGSGLGPPWSQDEKFSALVAWLSILN
jgi:uncharacterized Zn-binding protein involved in type VI secretion